MNVRHALRQFPVLGVNGSVRRLRNGIIRIALRARILVNYACPRVLLSGQVLEFRDAGVIEVVRIIHYRHRLKLFAIDGLVLEVERPIREPPETEIEILIDRSAVDELPESYPRAHLAIISA